MSPTCRCRWPTGQAGVGARAAASSGPCGQQAAEVAAASPGAMVCVDRSATRSRAAVGGQLDARCRRGRAGRSPREMPWSEAPSIGVPGLAQPPGAPGPAPAGSGAAARSGTGRRGGPAGRDDRLPRRRTSTSSAPAPMAGDGRPSRRVPARSPIACARRTRSDRSRSVTTSSAGPSRRVAGSACGEASRAIGRRPRPGRRRRPPRSDLPTVDRRRPARRRGSPRRRRGLIGSRSIPSPSPNLARAGLSVSPVGRTIV